MKAISASEALNAVEKTRAAEKERLRGEASKLLNEYMVEFFTALELQIESGSTQTQVSFPIWHSFSDQKRQQECKVPNREVALYLGDAMRQVLDSLGYHTRLIDKGSQYDCFGKYRLYDEVLLVVEWRFPKSSGKLPLETLERHLFGGNEDEVRDKPSLFAPIICSALSILSVIVGAIWIVSTTNK